MNKKKPLTFEYSKHFLHTSGNIIRMKALVTIHGKQYVDNIDDNRRYDALELEEINY